MNQIEKQPQITICVAVWNEVKTLEKVVNEILHSLRTLQVPFEVLIIDDGSKDGSEKIAETLANSISEVRVIHHPQNLGLGYVYRTGFKEARGDFLSFFPADGQFPASIIEKFYPVAKENDLVLGYLPERKGSILGRFLSKAERICYHILLGKIPRFEGIFMVRRSILKEIPLYSEGRGWSVVMELVIRASKQGYRIVSLPTQMRPRESGKSKVNNLRHIFINLKELLKLRRYIKET